MGGAKKITRVKKGLSFGEGISEPMPNPMLRPPSVDIHEVLTSEIYVTRYKKATLTKDERVLLDKMIEAVLNFVTK